jgi:P27 family predicted phage terminase small subunit
MGARGPITKAKAGTIKFRQGVPPPPPWLNDVAAEEYNRAAAELEAADASVQQPDMAVLASYAQSYAEVALLTKEIERTGWITEGQKGEVANPLIAARAKSYQTLLACTQKLGFSPADRARVPKAAASSRPDNAFNDYIQ